MSWYNKVTAWFAEKANPAQEYIGLSEGTNISSNAMISYATAFDKLETVNRGTNMIVSACASLEYDVKDKKGSSVAVGVRQKSLVNLLNFAPNPYQSTQEFRNAIFTDFILEGNIFIYYDGVYMYHLPAASVVVQTDTKTFVSGYTYNGVVQMQPDEVIHIKDLSGDSIYRGTSRLASADRNIKILYSMQNFQNQFFDNGGIFGLILTSENTLSQTAKEKTITNWMQKYSMKNGAKRPMILDSGLKPAPNLGSSFQEMDYNQSIEVHDTKILKSLGVPPVLMDGGNNANISPNLRLFYLETVMPIVTKYVSAMERFFGYDIEPVTSSVSALQPDIKETAAYYSTLVNTGIITANEARQELRFEKDTDPESDKLRIPANIAGSAANPSSGGAPPKAGGNKA